MHSLFFICTHCSARWRRGMGRGSRRWSTRSVRPLWALAKTPCTDGAVRPFLFCPRACEHGAGLGCLPGGARKACAPVRHSQKQPCYAQPLFHLHTLFCAVASTVCTNEKQPLAGLLLLVGAGGRTRTDTDFTPQDFESSASASFTTPAQITIYHSVDELTSVLRSSARARSLFSFHGD